LNRLGSTPKNWDIYRGDSFQAVVNDPLDAITTAIRIKAALKSIKGVDVRMAIGIGNRTYNTKNITETSGSAFVNSGELVEALKSMKVNLAVRSQWPDFDAEVNLYLKLALVAMDSWTTNSAEIVHVALQNPGKSQLEYGKTLGIKQNAVSARLKRACYYEIVEVIDMYKMKLKKL
jgi:hypothetical protein